MAATTGLALHSQPFQYPRAHEPTQIPSSHRRQRRISRSFPKLVRRRQPRPRCHPERNREAPRRIRRSACSTWIRQPSIAAEHRGMDEGCDLTMRMLRDAGFGEVTKIPTDGQPGIFATLDAGAPRTIGIYFMYDVKQVDPAEWSSPPFEAALVDKPGPGKGRHRPGRGQPERPGGFLPGGAARDSRRRPQASRESCVRGGRRRRNRLAALSANRASSRGAGGAEQMQRAFTCPSAEQDLDGKVTMTLGAKGVVELELVSSGEKWGRGPRKDVHSSLKAMIDSPAWHLVEALVHSGFARRQHARNRWLR